MIAESETRNNGRVIVTGVLQRANAKNQNGRVYPKEILMREVKNYKKINVKDVWWKGDDVMGTVEVLGTPAGNILKELLRAGVKLGISSRGLGSIEEIYEGGEQAVRVKDDFELICWDFVSNPSTHGAFMAPMNEGVKGAKTVNNKYDKINGLISEILCEMTGKCEIPNLASKDCCGE